MMNTTLRRSSGHRRVTATFVGALLTALALVTTLWMGPTGAQTCPPGEICEPPNFSPRVRADSASVVVVQGQTATNTGTYSDDDSPGNVAITASVGEVTKTGTNSGTWSWSLTNAPLGRQRVTITATDSAGASRTTAFTLTATLPNGKIAFNRATEIYTTNPDGSGQINLTSHPAGDHEPAYAPDGTRIVFQSGRNGNQEVYVMNANGGGLMRLTNNSAHDSDPTFSPDGTRIAFTSNRDINNEVYIMDADGAGQTNLTNDFGDDSDPAFSPDGTKVAYTHSFGDFDSEIYVMNSDGTGKTNLTDNGADDSDPVYAPDGTRIAFTSTQDGNEEVYVMDADGTDQIRLTSNAVADSGPSFSPDGTRVAFTSYRDGDAEVYVMNSDGTSQTNLTNNTVSDTSPSWGGASDAAPPETTVASGPSGPVTSNSAEFGFSSSEPDSVFECSLDGSPFELCSSSTSYPNLAEGQHTFQVRATDVSGNTDPTPASRTWTVDTTVPETTIDSGPSGTVNSSSATFAFSSTEANSAFECRLTKQGDTPGTFAACTSPKRYVNLADGSYTFEVRAKDAAGNTDQSPASRAWTVDATAPNTTIDVAPPPVTNSKQASFYFSSSEDDSTFECSLDGDTWQACNSPKDYANLSDGQHTFSVRAKDAVGNVDGNPASHNWSVDTTAPTVESVSPAAGAPKVSRLTNVTATFSEEMDPSTLSSSTVTLKNAKTGAVVTDVGVTATVNSEGKTVVTLDPFPSNTATKLAKKTRYEVRITTGAKDPAGNSLAAEKIWSFTTGRK